jgi:hypothetical protein
MHAPHFHLTGMEVFKIVAVLVILKYLGKPLVAHYRSNPAIQGLGFVID